MRTKYLALLATTLNTIHSVTFFLTMETILTNLLLVRLSGLMVIKIPCYYYFVLIQIHYKGL